MVGAVFHSSVPLPGKGSLVTYWLLQVNQGAPIKDPLVITHNSSPEGAATPAATPSLPSSTVALEVTTSSERSDSSGSSSSSRQRAASNPNNQVEPTAQRARGETIQVSPQDISRHVGKLDQLRVAATPSSPSYQSSSRGTMPAADSESRRQSAWSDLAESRRTSWQRVKREPSDSGQTSPSNHPWSPRSDNNDADSAQGMELSPQDDMPTRSRSISRDFCVQIEGEQQPSPYQDRRGSEARKRPSHMVVPMAVLLEEADERESRYGNSTSDLASVMPNESGGTSQTMDHELPLHIDLNGANWQVSCL